MSDRPALPLNAYDPAKAWLLGLAITLLLMGLFRSLGEFGSLFPVLMVAFVIARRKQVSVKDTFHLKPCRAANLLFPACFSLSFGSAETFILEAIDLATGGRFGRLADAVSPELPGDTLLATMLFAVVFAPLVEELFFRGFFMSSMVELGMGWAVIFPSLFFAIGHSPFSWPSAFAGAVASSIFVLNTGSIAAGVTCHAAMNLLGTGLPLIHQALPGRPGEVACLAVRMASVGMAFLFIREYKSLWTSVRRHWADFRGEPGVKSRVGYLLKHWSYKVILVLLVATVLVYGVEIATGRSITVSGGGFPLSPGRAVSA